MKIRLTLLTENDKQRPPELTEEKVKAAWQNVVDIVCLLSKNNDNCVVEKAEFVEEVMPSFRWIPIDHKPTTTGLYLVLCNEWGGARRRICAYCHETEKWIDGGKNISKYITHWTPLPELPEEGN